MMLQISSNSVTGFQGTFYGEANLHIDSQGGGQHTAEDIFATDDEKNDKEKLSIQ